MDRVTDPKGQTTGPEVSTVWVAGLLPEKQITEQDLKDHFYSFGEIVKIRMVPASKCAFVEFVSHEQASSAIDTLRNNLVIRGQFLKVGWAKPQANRSDRAYAAADAATTPNIPPPPGFVPYNPIAPGAPPPGAAGPLGWAPVYYPSMNPQRMGATDHSSSQASSQPTHKPAHNLRSHTQHSDSSAPTDSVPATSQDTSDIPPGARVKRQGGSAPSETDDSSNKKVKV